MFKYGAYRIRRLRDGRPRRARPGYSRGPLMQRQNDPDLAAPAPAALGAIEGFGAPFSPNALSHGFYVRPISVRGATDCNFR